MTAITTAGGTAIRANSARFRPVLAATISSLVAVSGLPAQAGTSGSITFSPASAAAIPALGGWLLVLLAGLLAMIALKAYHRSQHGIAPMVAGALALGSLASAGGGFDLITQAQAVPADTEITDPQGQTLPLPTFGGTTIFLNTAGVPMEVRELVPSQFCTLETTTSEIPDCREGSVVAEQERCQVDLSCPG